MVMPRSGSSIVEELLTRSKSVDGLSERMEIGQIVAKKGVIVNSAKIT